MNNEEKDIESVKLGYQVWMLKNLDVSHYRNGDPICEVTNADEWCNLDFPAWCYYNNDPMNGKKYGKLYNLYAVDDPRGLAPKGWHIPTDAEWEILNVFLGGDKGEEAFWNEVRLDDKSIEEFEDLAIHGSFCAVPGGYRDSNGEFCGAENDVIGDYCGNWWSINEKGFDYDNVRSLFLEYSSILLGSSEAVSGNSVRCIKD